MPKRTLFFLIFFLIFLIPLKSKAVNIGDVVIFNVDDNFDAFGRTKVQSTLVKITSHLYFYVESVWWNSQDLNKKNLILGNLDILAAEFSDKIYPKLTSIYGSEDNPGIDKDSRITILFHQTLSNLGGYVRTADGYIKLKIPSSNEREMIYLPINQIESNRLKVFLAHEFTHLITLNQKDKILGVQEDLWLNEARADYSSTLLGYDDVYPGSNLQKRTQIFFDRPHDSIVEWQNTEQDYASVHLFTQYLVDHYGLNILVDSLKSSLVGISSINEALSKRGIAKNFQQIFTDWTITLLINDCKFDLKYCYRNQNLAGLRINPTLNFLPLTGNSSLSVTNFTKNWTGNWQKIIGGKGNLKLEFSGIPGLVFQIPYIIYDKENKYSVDFLNLNNEGKGIITIDGFGSQYTSLILLPSLQTKLSNFEGVEFSYPYTFVVSILENGQNNPDLLIIQKLLNQIDSLKKQIAALQSNLDLNSNIQINSSCVELKSNLYIGVSNRQEVLCLQNFLKEQGNDIYPEGLVTGNFGQLTKSAVIRFQEKYRNEILIPLGIFRGTGFVGPATRMKINQLLHVR